MNCNQLPTEELLAWLDGEANAEESARVGAHLAECAECRREAAALRESGDLLARLPGLDARAGFEARVVAAAESGGVATAPRGSLRFLRPRVAAAAAAVLVGVTAGAWWLANGSASNPADVLSSREEEALAEDLAVISNLDALQKAESPEIAQIVDDLDVLDAAGAVEDEDG